MTDGRCVNDDSNEVVVYKPLIVAFCHIWNDDHIKAIT